MKTILAALLITAAAFGATASNGVTISVPRSITAVITVTDANGVVTTRSTTATPAVLAACAHLVADTSGPSSVVDNSSANPQYADCGDLIIKNTVQALTTIVAQYVNDPAVAAALATAAAQPAVQAAISAASAAGPPPAPAVQAAATPTVTVSH